MDATPALATLFARRARLSPEPSLVEIVAALRAMPYARPSARTAVAAVREWRGTCSTKHLVLAALCRRWPELDVHLVCRVYRVDRDAATTMFPASAAALVPTEGLVDVHLYATALVGGRRIAIDVTFPGPPWDGSSSMALACGPGEDVEAGDQPLETKARLERERCDPALREPFIAALATSAPAPLSGAES